MSAPFGYIKAESREKPIDVAIYGYVSTARCKGDEDFSSDKINFDRFTRVVAGLVEVVSDLAK